MKGNKHTAQAATAPAPRQRRTWFASPGGTLRTPWLLAISLAGYALVALAARRALSAGFDALFAAWGIDEGNAWRAPSWARLVYSWHGSAVTALVSAALLVLTASLRRLWLGRTERARLQAGALGAAALAGTIGAIGIAALCLIPDSVRLQWPLASPNLAPRLLPLLAISLLAALSEEAFLKRVLFEGLRGRWGLAWAYIAVCAFFFLSNGGWSGNAVSGINVLLLGAVCCALYERCGLWAVAGFRWGWSAATVFLLGFGGGDAAVYRLYGVSEALLTGGDAGPIYGLWTTIALAAALVWLCASTYGLKTLSSLLTMHTSKGRPS